MSTITNNTAAATGATSPTSSTGTGSQTSAQAQNGLNTDYQDFLQLLTTQLQNQDPTAPMDTNALTQQIAELSQVEQQINTNTKLDSLISLFSGNQVSNAVGYIGKQVDATGNQIELTNSQAQIVYNLPSTATSSTVTITNSAGQQVYSAAGTTIAGRNQLLWQGTDSATGATAPDGNYTFTVTAKDSTGTALTPTTYTTGTVTAVDTQNGTDTLSLGSISVPLSSVQAVYTAGTNPSS